MVRKKTGGEKGGGNLNKIKKKGMDVFLAHLAKGHVSFRHRMASVCPSVSFSHLTLLL